MGINRILVKNVFSKSRSVETHESNMRSNAAERRRWSSVRSYLCGDEFNSVLAEEDSASVRSSKATELTRDEFNSVFADEDSASARSSEATVTQPIREGVIEKEKTQEEKQNSTSKLFRKEDAALVIQSAFRSFLARRQNRLNLMEESKQEAVVTTGSPSRDSVGTSIEVQTGNSTEVFSLHEESMGAPNRMQQKGRSQVWKLKEDWDDSTLSSNIIKMRIQNRVEATTRRERALAYAFSQQLRVCSKKRPPRSDGTEANMGWSWLERWMATRQQESSLMDISKQVEAANNNQRSTVRKRLLFDGTGEEKESCGSNEVSIQFDSISVTTTSKERDEFKPAQLRLKATSVSRRKTVPSSHCPKDNSKVSKKECTREDEKDKKYKPKQQGSKSEAICDDAISQVSADLVNTTINNSNLEL